MSTLTDGGYPTLADVVRTLKPDGTVEQNMAEMLMQLNPIMEDIPWVQGNLETGHRIISRTGLPSPTWRRLNEGVAPTKSRAAPFDESCGMLEDYSNVDCALAKLHGDAGAFRASEDKAKLQGFAQEVSRAFFYQSALLDPEKVHGMSPRYAATTGYTASSYVLKPGTVSGVNAHSVWLINWSPETIFGIFPKNSVAGLQHTDRGQQTIRDSSGLQFEAFVSHFKWDLGFAVKDYRHAVRMQWDVDDTTLFGDDDKGMIVNMQAMLDTIRRTDGNLRFYMDRTSLTKLNAQRANASTNLMERTEVNKKLLPSFFGVPIRMDEQLIAETAIS